MEIKKVITDKFFEKEYIYINSDVHDTKTALKLFREQEAIIPKSKNKDLHPAKATHLNYRCLPSDNKIAQVISKKRQEIYKSLWLSKTKNLKKQRKQAFKIAKYLINNVTYYLPIKEETIVQISANYKTALDKQLEKVQKAELLLNFTKAKLKANYIENNEENQGKIALFESILLRQVEKTYDILKAQKADIYNAFSKTAFRSIYKALFEKKGVCSDYAYAYSYLLNGLGIENKVAHAKHGAKESPSYQVFNMIEVLEENKKQYGYVDITDIYTFIKDMEEKKPKEKLEKVIKDYFDLATFVISKEELERNLSGFEIRQLAFIEELDGKITLELENKLDQGQIEEIKQAILKEDPHYKEFYDSIVGDE